MRDPVLNWECSSHWIGSSLFFFSSLCSLWLSLLLFFFFFFHRLLQNACPRATMSETVSHFKVVFGGRRKTPLLPCYVLCVHPDPTHQTTPPRTLAEWAPKHTDLCTDYVITSKCMCVSLSLLCRSVHWCFVTSDPNRQFKTIKTLCFFSHALARWQQIASLISQA